MRALVPAPFPKTLDKTPWVVRLLFTTWVMTVLNMTAPAQAYDQKTTTGHDGATASRTVMTRARAQIINVAQQRARMAQLAKEVRKDCAAHDPCGVVVTFQ